LAPGLCIFGDNAYLNTMYLATPHSAVSGGTKDSYNFYHSQLRIRIECAFEIWTHRWAILRSPIPVNVSIKKSVALVIALAKLHNYCIDCDETVTPSTASNKWQSEVNGAIPLVTTIEAHHDLNCGRTPRQLLDGGNHFDDIGSNGRYNRQRCHNYLSESVGIPLPPRDYLHSFVASVGLTQPLPAQQASSTCKYEKRSCMRSFQTY
jgi:hypothetical protein